MRFILLFLIVAVAEGKRAKPEEEHKLLILMLGCKMLCYILQTILGEIVHCANGQRCETSRRYAKNCDVFVGPKCDPPCHLEGCVAKLEHEMFCNIFTCALPPAAAMNRLPLALGLGLPSIVVVAAAAGALLWRRHRRGSSLQEDGLTINAPPLRLAVLSAVWATGALLLCRRPQEEEEASAFVGDDEGEEDDFTPNAPPLDDAVDDALANHPENDRGPSSWGRFRNVFLH
jgi:hypothetical protein